MGQAVNAHDGREQRLDLEKRVPEAVVVHYQQMGAQLHQACAAPVSIFEPRIPAARRVERVDCGPDRIDLNAAFCACLGECLVSAAAVVEA